MCVCVYVCMYIDRWIDMYVCKYVRLSVYVHACMHVCMFLCLPVSAVLFFNRKRKAGLRRNTSLRAMKQWWWEAPTHRCRWCLPASHRVCGSSLSIRNQGGLCGCSLHCRFGCGIFTYRYIHMDIYICKYIYIYICISRRVCGLSLSTRSRGDSCVYFLHCRFVYIYIHMDRCMFAYIYIYMNIPQSVWVVAEHKKPRRIMRLLATLQVRMWYIYVDIYICIYVYIYTYEYHAECVGGR